jgi:hypothetical protein
MQSDILRITEAPLVDEGIESYEWKEYKPVAGTDLNSPGGEINIYVELQSLFTHPAESYLQFEGRLTKADGSAYDNDNAVALAHNGLMYLFNQITYT